LDRCLPAQADKKVREIVIHSRWGGLGTPQALAVKILGTPDGFQRDGKPVKPALVQALISAAEAPPISKPDATNLGITRSWLQSQLAFVEDRMLGKMPDATARQKALFESALTDPEKIRDVLPSLFTYTSFDDYPSAEVKIKFSDDSQLTLTSHSYYEFMLPWTIHGSKNLETYNADISRAISALLPPKNANKERLAGPEFGFHLADAVMNRIEKQWKEIVVIAPQEFYFAAGEHAKAAAEFERIIDHRGWGWWQVYAPLAHLGLARACAGQGERKAAKPTTISSRRGKTRIRKSRYSVKPKPNTRNSTQPHLPPLQDQGKSNSPVFLRYSSHGIARNSKRDFCRGTGCPYQKLYLV
jgi:hypothetical protein